MTVPLTDADVAELAEKGDLVGQPLRGKPYVITLARELQELRAAARAVMDWLDGKPVPLERVGELDALDEYAAFERLRALLPDADA